MIIVFKLIDMTIGLRVTEEEEIEGLDAKEHGLASAYAGFSIMDATGGINRYTYRKMRIRILERANTKKLPKRRKMPLFLWPGRWIWIQVCIKL